MTMTETGSATTWGLLDEAHRALRAVVAGVGVSDWAARTPCEQWSVAQVLRHAAGDQLAYAAAITGAGGPSENPFDPAAEPPGQPLAFLDAALAAATQAFGTVVPGASQVPTPLPQGPLPAEIAVGAAALDAAVHAWDIAVATAQASPLPADLAAQLMPAARAIAEPLRGFAFAPALDPRSGDDATSALLRYLGRTPDWKS